PQFRAVSARGLLTGASAPPPICSLFGPSFSEPHDFGDSVLSPEVERSQRLADGVRSASLGFSRSSDNARAATAGISRNHGTQPIVAPQWRWLMTLSLEYRENPKAGKTLRLPGEPLVERQQADR